MRKRIVVAILAFSLALIGLSNQNVSAADPSVVISQVQLGTAASASYEFIELYNNSDSDVEITNWCLYYASATSTTKGSKLGCFSVENANLHLFFPKRTYSFAISQQLLTVSPTLGSDLLFSAGLAGTAGHIRIMDSHDSEIDKVAWGLTAVSPEGSGSAPVPTSGKILARKVLAPTVLQDTNNNVTDFEIVSPKALYNYGSIYEIQDVCSNIEGIQTTVPTGYSQDASNNCVPPPVDICLNIDGLQVSIPSGYALDDSGACQQDVCSNIAGLQTVVPPGKELTQANECVDHDYCTNLSGTQAVIPTGYLQSLSETCLLDVLPIIVTEIFANAIGSDEGNEYIELYNPNDIDVSLDTYVVKVGLDAPKTYAFPGSSLIASHTYMIFTDDDIPFTLVNTASQIALQSTDGQSIDAPPAYNEPDDGTAWALIDGSWEYTNQPTPAAANMPSEIIVDTDVEEEAVGLKPCAANQYRHPETNRCRLLVSAGSTVVACKDGQYRSEVTNRCRAIASDVSVLTPCDANQYRSTETNRCRLLGASTTALVACKTGQVRSTETNRCRTVLTTVPTAAFAVQAIAVSPVDALGWVSFAAVAAVALGYAIWEWRIEIKTGIQKITRQLRSR